MMQYCNGGLSEFGQREDRILNTEVETNPDHRLIWRIAAICCHLCPDILPCARLGVRVQQVAMRVTGSRREKNSSQLFSGS